MTFIDDTGGRHFVGECERGYCVREVLAGGYDHLAAPETESRHHRGGRKHGSHHEAEEVEGEQSLFGDG